MRKREGGLARTDPAFAELLQNAQRNVAARTSKQKRDAERVRIRLDVPETLRDILASAAADVGTSSSQLGAALLAWGLIRLLSADPQLHEYIGSHATPSKALRIDVDLELDPLLETLTDLALGQNDAESAETWGH